MPADVHVERELRIEARPEIVFLFLTDASKMPDWMGLAAQSDPRPGGVYAVNILGEAWARGEFLVVEPPRRVVFTWTWDSARVAMPAGTSTVEFTLAPEGDGTLLRLRHSGLPEGTGDFHGAGWDHYLPRLAAAAAGAPAGADPWAAAPVETAERFLRDAL